MGGAQDPWALRVRVHRVLGQALRDPVKAGFEVDRPGAGGGAGRGLVEGRGRGEGDGDGSGQGHGGGDPAREPAIGALATGRAAPELAPPAPHPGDEEQDQQGYGGDQYPGEGRLVLPVGRTDVHRRGLVVRVLVPRRVRPRRRLPAALRDDLGEDLELPQGASVVGEFVEADREGVLGGRADAEGHGFRDRRLVDDHEQPVLAEPVVHRAEQALGIRGLARQYEDVRRDTGALRHPREVRRHRLRHLAGQLVGDVHRVLTETSGQIGGLGVVLRGSGGRSCGKWREQGCQYAEYEKPPHPPQKTPQTHHCLPRAVPPTHRGTLLIPSLPRNGATPRRPATSAAPVTVPAPGPPPPGPPSVRGRMPRPPRAVPASCCPGGCPPAR